MKKIFFVSFIVIVFCLGTFNIAMGRGIFSTNQDILVVAVGDAATVESRTITLLVYQYPNPMDSKIVNCFFETGE